LTHATETEKNNEKNQKQKNELLRRNDPIKKLTLRRNPVTELVEALRTLYETF